MKKTILFVLVSIFLMSCGHHRDGTSVWAEGLWIIPVGLLLASAWSFYRAYRASKSGSNPYDASGKLRRDIETGNVPIYKVNAFKFAVVFLVAAIAVLIMVNANK